jgi:hypothetical protein
MDVKVVSGELGHATTHFTQDTYQTVFPEVARAEAEATAAMLKPVRPSRWCSRTGEYTRSYTAPPTPGRAAGSLALAWGSSRPGVVDHRIKGW